MSNFDEFCEALYNNLFKISQLDKINKQKILLTKTPIEVTYKKTHTILNLSNIDNNKNLITYPTKINLKIRLIDIHNQLDDIITYTKSRIINNFNELLYYINIFIDITNQNYILKQSSLEDN
jgi:hypothetical protein